MSLHQASVTLCLLIPFSFDWTARKISIIHCTAIAEPPTKHTLPSFSQSRVTLEVAHPRFSGIPCTVEINAWDKKVS